MPVYHGLRRRWKMVLARVSRVMAILIDLGRVSRAHIYGYFRGALARISNFGQNDDSSARVETSWLLSARVPRVRKWPALFTLLEHRCQYPEPFLL